MNDGIRRIEAEAYTMQFDLVSKNESRNSLEGEMMLNMP